MARLRPVWARSTEAAPIQRQCTGCAPGRSRPATVDSLVYRTLTMSGRPLDPATMAYFSNRTGQDLGGVRVHDDSTAAASAQALAARAYTVGQHIVFGAGALAPATSQVGSCSPIS